MNRKTGNKIVDDAIEQIFSELSHQNPVRAKEIERAAVLIILPDGEFLTLRQLADSPAQGRAAVHLSDSAGLETCET